MFDIDWKDIRRIEQQLSRIEYKIDELKSRVLELEREQDARDTRDMEESERE